MKNILLTLILVSLSSVAYTQTTSLVVNYDLRGFPNVSYLDSFTMRYSNGLDSVWSIEHTFHCSKDFNWSDTISPVPEGDIQVTIFRDTIKVLESYFWVTANRLNEVDITINRQYNRTKGAPFISEDFINFYFRVGSNFNEIAAQTHQQSAASFYSGFYQGLMFSKRFGISYGYGINYETSWFDNALTSQTNHFNYWSWCITPTLRFVPYTYENKDKLKRNTYLDVGVDYYFPLKFRFVQNNIGGKSRTVYRGLHNYQDVRLRASFNIGQVTIFTTYRLNDIVKTNNFMNQQLPTMIIGVGITDQL